MAQDVDWSQRRADARRDHERVLTAAIEVFTELGLDAPIAEVAVRAGVGKATVFRSYATKADLVRAIAQHHADWLHAVIDEVANRAEFDAYEALREGLGKIMARLARDRLMVEVLNGIEVLGGDDDRPRRIFALGREQGTLRPDASLFDVQVLVAGAARSLIHLDVRDPDVWRRYAELSVAALRP